MTRLRTPRWGWVLVVLPAILLTTASSANAQQTQTSEGTTSIFPNHGFLVTGYGAAGYQSTFATDSTPNDFTALMSPIFLFQISDRFLFEGELELELEDGATNVDLEYAQIDVALTNNLRLVAGKFLLPFNTFGERIHPTWINPFVSLPPIYGHHGGPGPAMPLLPILSDVGAQLRGSFDVGEFGYVTGAVFVSQGPKLEADEADAELMTVGATGGLARRMTQSSSFLLVQEEIPEVAIGENFEDNNTNKMVGGRIGAGIAPYLEVNLSAMTGKYDDAGDLSYTAFGAHLEARHRGFVLHGEWIRTEQDLFDEAFPTEIVSLNRDGYYLQFSYQYRKWQPLVRWSQIFDGKLRGETVIDSGKQFGLGIAYWVRPSLVLKGEYLVNTEGGTSIDNNRLAFQFGFGF